MVVGLLPVGLLRIVAITGCAIAWLRLDRRGRRRNNRRGLRLRWFTGSCFCGFRRFQLCLRSLWWFVASSRLCDAQAGFLAGCRPCRFH